MHVVLSNKNLRHEDLRKLHALHYCCCEVQKLSLVTNIHYKIFCKGKLRKKIAINKIIHKGGFCT